MNRYGHTIILLLICYCIHAQSDRYAEIEDLMDGVPFQFLEWNGHLNRALPLSISLGITEGDVQGYVYYGQDLNRYDLTGDITDGHISLYEFDEYNQIIGRINGRLDANENWSWSAPSSGLTLPITVGGKGDRIQLFTMSNSKSNIVVRPSSRTFTTNKDASSLRWTNYNCLHEDCFEEHPLSSSYNAIEFILTSDNLTLLNKDKDHYEVTEELPCTYESQYYDNGYYSYYLPDLGDKKFNNWATAKLIGPQVDESTQEDITFNRFSDIIIGDFYVTAWSEDLFSGYIYRTVNKTNKVQTFPFIFDRNKSRFYDINDIFKSDFDYAFFIDRYIGRIKKGRLIKEEGVIQSVLKGEYYKHYVLADEGILFFTDFSTLYGRRSILLPFNEILSYINNKAIMNYIKKRA